MNPEEIRLLIAARRAFEAGEDLTAINEAVNNRTGGRFASFQALAAAGRQMGEALPSGARGPIPPGPDDGGMQGPRYSPSHDAENAEIHKDDLPDLREPTLENESPADRADREALERLNARGGSAVEDFARMAVQGATFGFADEMAGGIGGLGALLRGESPARGYREARDASRQRVADLRRLNPGASAASELAGGVALPSAGFVRAGGTAAVRAGRVPGAAVRGAGVGAAGGGLYGAGEAEGGLRERLGSAGTGAAAGAAVGGPLAGVGSLALRLGNAARRGATRSDELAEIFGRLADAPDGKIGDARDVAKAAVQRVREEAYKPLEEAFEKVDDPEVLEVLKRPDLMRAVRKVMGRGDAADRAPSFRELQSIRSTLRGLRSSAERRGRTDLVKEQGDALRALDEVMERRIPGFAEAQGAYRVARATEEAFDQGWKLWNKPGEQIGRALNELPEEAREAFRLGLASRWYDKMARRGGTVTKGQVERLQSAGIAGRLREAFQRPRDYEEWARELERVGQARVDADKLVPAGKWLAKWLGAGAAAGSAWSLFN